MGTATKLYEQINSEPVIAGYLVHSVFLGSDELEFFESLSKALIHFSNEQKYCDEIHIDALTPLDCDNLGIERSVCDG